VAKRIKISHSILAPGDAPGQMVTLFGGTVIDLPDDVADLLRGAGVARLAPDADLVDTTPAEPAPAPKGKG
jgi:hypothetical protein